MISVIIPVLNESESIEYVVRFALSQDNVTEVIVVDDGSTDDTHQIASRAGARVVTSSFLGKGASLSDGLKVATNDIVVFLDGDMSGFVPDLIGRMVRPIVMGQANFVKAKFARSAGRVTTLTAKPLIQMFFPELSQIEQPLGGIVAARKSMLDGIELETDYGVDLGLLIDAHMSGEDIIEVDVGTIHHESQPLDSLSRMATQVSRAIFHRASKYNRLNIQHIMEVEENERQSRVRHESMEIVRGASRIALFDMDGTLVNGRFILDLAEKTSKQKELARYLDSVDMHSVERTRAIARVFRGVPMATFIAVAREIPLHDHVVETIRDFRKAGFQVGIISDSFRVATDTVRRRVFADFSIAHTMRFREGIATGEIGLCPAMFHEGGCLEHYMCKMNAVLHLSENSGIGLDRFVAVGDGENDACMLRCVGSSVAFRPKTELVRQSAKHIVETNFLEVRSKVIPTHECLRQDSAEMPRCHLTPNASA